jgi:hypothetical protein
MANAKSASGGRSIILRDMCRLHGCFSLASRHGPQLRLLPVETEFSSAAPLLARAKTALARLYFPSGIRQSLRHLDAGRVPSRSGVVSRLHVAPAFLPAAPRPFAPTQCKGRTRKIEFDNEYVILTFY